MGNPISISYFTYAGGTTHPVIKGVVRPGRVDLSSFKLYGQAAQVAALSPHWRAPGGKYPNRSLMTPVLNSCNQEDNELNEVLATPLSG